jgi:23S rRNA (pseudouridine1915-N3)-methyltransferase
LKISIVAVGHKMPAWVNAGFKVYQQRMPKHFRLKLIEVPAVTRTPNMPVSKAMAREGERVFKYLHADDYVVALDEHGMQWTSKKLAGNLEQWQKEHQQVTFLVGGADGLSESCKQRADVMWSLSHLTLPHGMVRIQLCEQIYRGWTLIQGHPYHRN